MVKAKAETTVKAREKTSNKSFVSQINKRFGEGTMFSLAGEGAKVKVTPIPTTIPSLDYALGIGGIPLGRMIEIYGPESAGKTTLTLYVVKGYQAMSNDPSNPEFGRKVAFIDVENSLDPVHSLSLGVDISDETGMIVAQPESSEAAYDLIGGLVNSGEVGLIIVDSLAAMVPQKVIENSASDATMGLAARINSEQMKKLLTPMNKNNCTVIFINQIREKVGVMYGELTV